MTQIINEKLKKCCNQCNKYMDSPCAWLSLGNEYCDEIMEVNEEIERLEKRNKEIERLNNIIKEVREYIDEWNMNWYATGSEEDHQRLEELKDRLEVLDKGE